MAKTTETTATANTEEQAAPAGNGAGDDQPWYHELDAKHHEAAQGFKSVESLLTTAVNRQKEISARPPKDAVVVPKDDASDEVKAAYAKAVGIPENAEAYELDLGLKADPEHPEQTAELPDEELVNGFRAAAHAHGLTNRQAQGVVTAFVGQMRQRVEQVETTRQDAIRASSDYLQKQFGENTEARVRAIGPMLEALTGGPNGEAIKGFLREESFPGGVGLNGVFKMAMVTLLDLAGPDRFIDPERLSGDVGPDPNKPNLRELYPQMYKELDRT